MTTSPAQAGLSRREDILGAAARLFAARGYHGVGVDEIGAAVGITGPGLYRHFRGKKAMLAELLVGISEQLLRTGRSKAAAATDPGEALDALVRWHVGFALDSPELITLHGRELAHLSDRDRKQVRRLQRQYVELWVDVVVRAHPLAGTGGTGGGAESAERAESTDGTADGRGADLRRARVRAGVHAAFGLINSTPYTSGAGSVAHHDGPPVPDRTAMETLLHRLAHAALAAI